jgi:NADH dehydrogenase [ubiquinone] 1 alpha subcomplex assembly factor 5
VADLFDMKLRGLRRDRAARVGPELFLLQRAFADCLEGIALLDRRFERALMIGCPDAGWPERLLSIVSLVDVRDPGLLFARAVAGEPIVEDFWQPPSQAYDLVLAIGTLDTVNDLPLALRLVRHSMRHDAMFMGALSGGETVPQLRAAVRAADALGRGAAPHIHPRIEPAALSPLLVDAGFSGPVVDVDRVQVSYPSLDRLIADLRAMAATNILNARPEPLTRVQLEAAAGTFAAAGDGQRTTETFEILHFAAWTPKGNDAALTV